MSGWLTCGCMGGLGRPRRRGLLPFTVTTKGPAGLLGPRSSGTDQGGTWGTVGGAIEPGEACWEEPSGKPTRRPPAWG